MKRLQCKMTACALCLLLGGCVRAETPVQTPVSEPSSSAVLSVAVNDDGGYDAYFATEREWEDITLDYQSAADYDGYYYFIDDPALNDGNGHLYKAIEVDENGELIPYEEMLAQAIQVIPDNINNYMHFARLNDQLIFVADDTRLIETDAQGGNRRVLYESDTPITMLMSAPEVTFFETDGAFYRCHRPSGRTDQVFVPTDKVESWRPISNRTIVYVRLTEAGKAYRASGIEPFSEDAHDATVPLAESVACNLLTGQTRLLTDADYEDGIEKFPLAW